MRYFPFFKMKRGLLWLPCKARYGTISLIGQVVAPVAPRYRSMPLGKRLVLDCFRVTLISCRFFSVVNSSIERWQSLS